ncbi:MAG: RNA polymerase factor sigma-54 [Gammaproteobacteria bacterium]|nr:MAG: RNA polymerase factor sigma-54 [Gammaproteobacteria bacterium]
MKQALQLKMGQHLAMTPQLQQAIKLLQLSSVELQTEIQEILDSNLMLELPENTEPEKEPLEKNEPSNSDNNSDSLNEVAKEEIPSATTDSIPDEPSTDFEWDDVYDGSTAYSAPSSEQIDMLENQSGGSETLNEHLMWQLEMSCLSGNDRIIAENIIDSIDDEGYLQTSTEIICEGLNNQYPDSEIEIDEIEAVLKLVQNYDPLGVGARDLRECLLIQINQVPNTVPWQIEAKVIIDKYLKLIGSRQYAQIMRKMKLDEEELQMVMNFIRKLNPKPGSKISSSNAQYIVPDVYVFKKNSRWIVELNQDIAPKIRINNLYANMIKRGDSSSDNNCMRNHLQEARWFIKSLKSRNETLLKVANCILNKQLAFFEEGEQAMKPLILREVAEEVEMHESTISRVTTQKYMHTPRGILEFKYFFSSHVSSDSGDNVSATAIRAKIKELIDNENPKKPLSDSKLSQILKDEGIDVARRTVAKYREAMNIPSSNERRRLV